MWTCTNCKEHSEDSFDSCWSCGVARDGTPPSENFLQAVRSNEGDFAPPSRLGGPTTPPPFPPSQHFDNARYRDAYMLAGVVTNIGGGVKVCALLLGLGIVLMSFLVAGPRAGIEYPLFGIAVGIAAAIPIWVLGVITSAVGQILRATLDTAVNTSRLRGP